MNPSNFLAFALGGPEIIGIGVIVLLLFGAKKLPELARGIGKASGEFKKAQNEFKHSLESAEEEAPSVLRYGCHGGGVVGSTHLRHGFSQ